MKKKFEDLHKSVLELIEERMKKIRFETRGVLEHQLQLLEANYENNETS